MEKDQENKDNKDQKSSPIIVPPDKEKEVPGKDKEVQGRTDNSEPEQFAELKEANLRMQDQELEEEESDEEK
jgi:hypothetical protein